MMEKARKTFLVCAALAGALAATTLVVATQYTARELAYHPALGTPIGSLGAARIYPPWSCLQWSERFEHRRPRLFASVQAIEGIGSLMTFMVFLFGVSRLRARPPSTAHGSARWATEADLRKAGLFDDAGVVLCQTADARYTSAPDGKGGVRWESKRAGTLIRHAGPEHVLVFAPTRSGKGVGTVIPTLLSWEGSTVVYDIKKELWSHTAGWRKKFSHCWRFEPTATGGVKYNPLFEIRRGHNEVRDAQNVAEILIDPDGKGDKDHWRLSGAALLTAAILHVLYAEADKSLRGVSAFLSDPSRTQLETLIRMLTANHLPTGPHPVVARTARAMVSKSADELSGVVSTAKAALTLYDDPIVAENTATSDFAISDLMNAAHPVSLYLVVPPSDIDRTRPLIRLLLQQFGKRLTERMDPAHGATAYKHRLLMMLDEFPSLGRLSFFETALAFSAGYGIKCFLICQSLTQLDKAYGRDNSIIDNCHVRLAYAANRPETAKTISDLVGQSTASKRQRNLSGKGLFGARSVGESEQEFARPLLTPDEILRLPFDEAILLVGGQPPYRARKVMYYLDARFRDRVPPKSPTPPDTPAEQKAELLPRGPRTEWLALPPALPANTAEAGPPAAAAVATDSNAPAPPAESLGTAWSEQFGRGQVAEASKDGAAAGAVSEERPRRSGALPL